MLIPPPDFRSDAAHAMVDIAILAAGTSQRMGTENKLLLEIDGRPLIKRTVEQALECSARRVAVILGHEADAIRQALDGCDVDLVFNERYREGMGATLRRAAEHATNDAALIVCVADIPHLNASVFDALIRAYREDCARVENANYRAFVACDEGKRRPPVLWCASALGTLRNASGDEGGRRCLRDWGPAVCEVRIETSLDDIDTPADLHRLTRSVRALPAPLVQEQGHS